MQIVPQQEVNLISTNVPENTEPAYDSEETYSEGDKVQLKNKIYECEVNNTIRIDPETNPLTWYYIGYVNKWAMFDYFMTSKTTTSGTIEVELGTQDVDSLALFGLYADSVTIELTNNIDSSVIFSKTTSLVDYEISDWWEWTYTQPTYKGDLFFRLPMVYDGTLKITIEQRDGISKCAYVAFGQSQNVGCTLHGAKVSYRSNSYKTRNKMGQVYLQKNISWKRATIPVFVVDKRIDDIESKFKNIEGVPTLFIGDEREGGFEALLIFGFYRDFDIPIGANSSSYEIEVESLG